MTITMGYVDYSTPKTSTHTHKHALTLLIERAINLGMIVDINFHPRHQGDPEEMLQLAETVMPAGSFDWKSVPPDDELGGWTTVGGNRAGADGTSSITVFTGTELPPRADAGTNPTLPFPPASLPAPAWDVPMCRDGGGQQ